MAFCAGTTPTSPMAFSRASTAWSRPPRPRLEATGPPATSRRSSTSSPASSNSAYPPETARSQDFGRLRPRLETVELPLRRVLHAAGRPIEAVWFSETGYVSALAYMEDGDAAEVGLIGRKG